MIDLPPVATLGQELHRRGVVPDAGTHPVVDLSIGTPVDRSPDSARAALAAASDAPGYPRVVGTEDLRRAMVRWFERRRGVTGLSTGQVLPTVGSKELIASLPTVLGLGPGDVVVHPAISYPTYGVGARIAGAHVCTTDFGDLDLPARTRLIWVNSPANPTGQVLDAATMRGVVAWARAHGAVVASDECYVELGWTARPVCVLEPDVCEGRPDAVLSLQSLSKSHSMAGYRTALVAGDPGLLSTIAQVRRHVGQIMPGPVQAAMTAALDDDGYVVEQRERYRRRRDTLLAGFAAAGFSVAHSEAGLYLWLTRDEPCWDSVGWLAARGILVGPGDFYGDPSSRFVRVALTLTDDAATVVARRLAASP